MKLEVGMYVRTKDGYIAKYDNSKHNCSGKYYGFASTIRDMRWEEYDDDCFLWESELKNISKSSYNIIDLIQVGDYVNGHRVIFVNETFTYASVEVETSGVANCEIIPKKDIKSIVTHEQMEQIAYKVGE